MRLIRWIRLLVTAVLCILSVGGAAEKLDPTVLEQAQPVQFADFAEWNYALPLELLEGNEYIVLANQERLLEEDYIPDALVKLTCRKISSDPIQMVDAAAGALSSMFDAAKEEGIVLYAHSGYRSYRTQKTMYYNRLKKNGGKDDGVVAYPGYSDHQTGLGIDVINKAGIGKRFTSAFANTKEGKWIAEHCWEHGFIVRYQKDKEEITRITFEPWHLRYVGVQVACYMRDHHLCLEEFTEEWENARDAFRNATNNEQ